MKNMNEKEVYNNSDHITDKENKLDQRPFADALKRAAKKKGITQDALAENINKSKNTVAQMFTAQRFTSIPTLIDLCRELTITPDYLLGAYLPQSGNMSEDEYHKLLKAIGELRPNEVYILFGIIELLKNNRDKK